MPTFGDRSERELRTAHPDLQRLFREVIKYRDCTVLEGHRSLERQAQLFAQGLTQKKTAGKHNEKPSLAVDVMPWFSKAPHIRWNDTRATYAFGGFVLGIAQSMGIRIRWGANWDGDADFDDHTLVDAPHYEILGE
jgi:peptidoglycan LD-endopeptidase CwlK